MREVVPSVLPVKQIHGYMKNHNIKMADKIADKIADYQYNSDITDQLENQEPSETESGAASANPSFRKSGISHEAARWQSSWEITPKELVKREKKEEERRRKKKRKEMLENLFSLGHGQSVERGTMTEGLIMSACLTTDLVAGFPPISPMAADSKRRKKPRAKSEMNLLSAGNPNFTLSHFYLHLELITAADNSS